MMKESILFVVSTGFLVYFIAPTGEEKAVPAPQEQAPKPQPVAEEYDEDEEWEDDEDEADEEEFVFGQPMTGSDYDDEDDDVNEDEDGLGEDTSASNAKEKAAAQIEYTDNTPKRRANPNSPKQGALGSSSNPVILETNTPTEINDDE